MPAETNRIQLFRLLRFGKIAAMSGGFLMLLLEIRFQHRAALIDDWRPWMPIVFCNLMIYLIPVAGIFWHKGGKQILLCAYGLTIALGVLGVYFHSEGHLIERLMELFSVWIIPPGQSAEIRAHYPPILAPLAFMGLGSIGLLFCFDSPLILSEIRVRTGDEYKGRTINDSRVSTNVESPMSIES